MKVLAATIVAALAATTGGVVAHSASATAPPVAIAPASVALDWNTAAVAAVRAAQVPNETATGMRALYQTEGMLYMAYVQAAVYDAATKIGHRYQPYHHFNAPAGNASLAAAVIAAAYNTLVYYLGDPSGTLAAKYTASIGALQTNATTQRGIAVGQAAAADIEALRANDGRNAAVGTYGVGTLQPGLWILAATPGSLQVAQTPWMAFMKPFMLESTSQFRAPPPPALTSPQYTADFNETKDYGALTGSLRSDEQTAIGVFWNANVISQVNQELRDAAVQHGFDLVDTAHLLAMGTMIPTDAGMACFDSKYTYLAWRPISAIRNADIDGNPDTTADPTWTPVLATPNHPEYPSQHGCFSGAAAEVLAAAAGSDAINATIWGATATNTTGLVTTRTFATVQDLLSQLVVARVYLGFHFRNSVVAGENIGEAVTNWELQRYFLPTS
jgi:PAP2 superfamily